MPGLLSQPSNKSQQSLLEAERGGEAQKANAKEPKPYKQKQPRPNYKQKKAGNNFVYS